MVLKEDISHSQRLAVVMQFVKLSDQPRTYASYFPARSTSTCVMLHQCEVPIANETARKELKHDPKTKIVTRTPKKKPTALAHQKCCEPRVSWTVFENIHPSIHSSIHPPSKAFHATDQTNLSKRKKENFPLHQSEPIALTTLRNHKLAPKRLPFFLQPLLIPA